MLPVQPRTTKIRQVSRRVATVMPEIGFDDEPISPVRRDETVTKRNPKMMMRMAAAIRAAHRSAGVAAEPLLLYDRHVMPYLYDKVIDLYAKAGVNPRMIPTPEAGPYNQAGLMLVASVLNASPEGFGTRKLVIVPSGARKNPCRWSLSRPT